MSVQAFNYARRRAILPFFSDFNAIRENSKDHNPVTLKSANDQIVSGSDDFFTVVAAICSVSTTQKFGKKKASVFICDDTCMKCATMIGNSVSEFIKSSPEGDIVAIRIKRDSDNGIAIIAIGKYDDVQQSNLPILNIKRSFICHKRT